MYCDYYKLSSEPFQLVEAPPPIFQHESYASARAGMQRALEQGNGMVVILGARGSGKSSLAGDFIRDRRAEKGHVATVGADSGGKSGLLGKVCREFGQRAIAQNKATLLHSLEDFLLDTPLATLVIDDADKLTEADFQDLRLLSYLRGPSRALLQIYLLGTEGLYEQVRSSGITRLHRGGIPVYAMGSLNVQETRDYVLHRLQFAGWSGNPDIPSESFRLIHQYAQGLPASIDDLCTQLLLHGAANQRSRLDTEDINSVIRALPGGSLPGHPGAAVSGDFPVEAEERDADPEEARPAVPEAAAGPEERVPPDRYPVLKLVADDKHTPAPDPDAGESAVGGHGFPRAEPDTAEGAQETRDTWIADAPAPAIDRQRSGPPEAPRRKRQPAYLFGATVAVIALLAGAYYWVSRVPEAASDGPRAGKPPVGLQEVPAVDQDAVALADREVAASDDRDPVADYEVHDTGVRAQAASVLPDTDSPLVGDSDPDSVAPIEIAEQYAVEVSYPERTEELNDWYIRHIKRREIERLLSLAERAFARDRLRTPEELSAWHYYEQVLDYDPDNADVEAGKREIAKRYGEIAYGEIQNRRYERALLFINRGLDLVPEDNELLSLKRKIAEKQGL